MDTTDIIRILSETKKPQAESKEVHKYLKLGSNKAKLYLIDCNCFDLHQFLYRRVH